MASGTTATSKVTPVTLGTSVRNRSQVFTATKVTETVDASGKKSFNVELVKFSDAKGSSPTTFGTRDANGNITFNNNASAKDKQFAQAHLRASKSQMESVKDKFELDSEGQKKFNQQNGNANKSPADNPQGDGSNPADVNTGTTAASGTNPKSGFGDLVYPIDLGQTKQDVIKFTMLEYKPSGIGAVGTSGNENILTFGGQRSSKDFKNRKSLGTVILPIPAGISDTNSADWGSNSMNALQAAVAGVAFASITQGFGAGLKSLEKSATNASQDEQAKPALASYFTAAAMQGDAASLLSRAEGTVINPNMELLFNGPQLRPFGFTFKMSARNQEEAQSIIKIINFFKRGMSPIRSESNLFLKAPNTFRVQYIHRPRGADKDHPYIGMIKECALQSCTVNYTPEGQYATFRDGVLVSYEITMQFQELEPVFNNDYEGLEGIGY
jgi:hypothetical protein